MKKYSKYNSASELFKIIMLVKINKKDVVLAICFIIFSFILYVIAFYPQAFDSLKDYIKMKTIGSIINTMSEQQKRLDETEKELTSLRGQQENLKKEKKSFVALAEKNKDNGANITASEIQKFLSGVVQIGCRLTNGGEVRGSGSLWNFGDLKYTVLTNAHVAGDGSCYMTANKEVNDGFGEGIYNLGKEKMNWNNLTDVSVLKIASAVLDVSASVSKLNYNISNLQSCDLEIPMGSPVVVIGYPAYAESDIDLGERGVGSLSNRTITEGTISARDSSVKYNQNLPYPNYFVTAKIDSGNSGGIAISKDGRGLCVLGIPTWLTIGNYDTSGLIQNIHNVFFSK